MGGDLKSMIGDVNLSMGLQGSEAAREASGIILLNDSFKGVIAALLYGRNVYRSVLKYLQFSLTFNLSCFLCSLICAVVMK